MTLAIILLFACVALTVAFYRLISLNKIAAMSELTRKQNEIESKYDYLIRRKLELNAKLTRKEQDLQTLINNQQGMRIKTADEMQIKEEGNDERISTMLISMGKISVEQHEKVMQKMELLKMDYLSTCLTLGFIDPETGNKIKKNQRP